LEGTERKYLHTVNGTALAVPRIIVALLENNWNYEK
jgi:seryl-tRNA synthetase